MSRIAAVAAALIAASPAFAQPRGPVVPNFQQPDKQAAAPAPAAPATEIDLVGPTAAQQARAQAAAEAKAKAEAEAKAAADQQARDEATARLRAQADAMAKADADAMAAADAEARAKADAAAKARLEAENRIQAEAQAKATAAAEKQRKVDEARKSAAAALAAAKEKALQAALAHRRAVEEARVAARAAVEAQKHAREEAAAQKREEARAKQAEAESRARARALALARKREEAKCGAGRKAAKCRAAVAARYDGPALPLEGAATAAEPLALTPLIATPPPPAAAPAAEVLAAPAAEVPAATASRVVAPVAAPVAAPAPLASRAVAFPNAPVASTGDRRVLVPAEAPAPGTAAVQLASAPVAPIAARPASVRTSPGAYAPATASAVLAVPRDEQPQRRRAAEVVNDLQLGPQSLVLDNLFARGELLPGALQLDFGYRFAIDDAGAPHHLFLAGLESGRCLAGDACGLRWFARGGFGPHNANVYSVDRRVNGTLGTHQDTLGWSANVLQAGLGYGFATATVLADAQLEGLTEEYLKNIDLAGPPRVNGSLRQLRLRGSVGLQGGGFSAQARVATYSYSGDPAASFKDVPLRGALLEDDMPGLAGALQSFSARLEGRWESAGGFALAASYGYLSYLGPIWSNANIFAGSVTQRFGRFRIGLGIVAEQEADAQGNGYPTVFGTGSVGAAF